MNKILKICFFAFFLFNCSILLSQNKIKLYLNSGITYNCYRGDNYFPPEPNPPKGNINVGTSVHNYAGGTIVSIPDYSTGLQINYCFKNKFIVESGIMYMRRNYYKKRDRDTILKYTPTINLLADHQYIIKNSKYNNIEIPINVAVYLLKSRIIFKVGVNICIISYQNHYSKDIYGIENEYNNWKIFEEYNLFFPSANIEFPFKIKNFGFNAYFTYFEKFNKNYDINFGLNFKLFDIKSR